MSEVTVSGTLSNWDGDTGTLLVKETLKGYVAPGDTLQVSNNFHETSNPWLSYKNLAFTQGSTGTWFLIKDTHDWVLIPVDPESWSVDEVERVTSGLDRVDSPPSDATIQGIVSESDAIFFGSTDSVDGTTAEVTVTKTLKGTPPETLTLMSPLEAGAVGSWRFPTNGTHYYGVFFADQRGDTWQALNPTSPYFYSPQDVASLSQR